MKRSITIILALFLISACNDSKDKTNTTNVSDSATSQKELEKKEPEIVDTGQVWFRVNITKNDTPYIHYEGDWPLLLMSNNSVTLQLAASKNLMSITNMLTIYMTGLPTGRIAIDLAGGQKDKASMIMSEVINGRYDIAILPSEGYLNITTNTGNILSGNFETKAVNDKNEKFLLTGLFLNVPVNDSDKIK